MEWDSAPDFSSATVNPTSKRSNSSQVLRKRDFHVEFYIQPNYQPSMDGSHGVFRRLRKGAQILIPGMPWTRREGVRAAGTPLTGQGAPEVQEDHFAAGWPGGRGIHTGQGDEDRGPRRARAQTRSLRIWNRRQ